MEGVGKGGGRGYETRREGAACDGENRCGLEARSGSGRESESYLCGRFEMVGAVYGVGVGVGASANAERLQREADWDELEGLGEAGGLEMRRELAACDGWDGGCLDG